MIGAINALIACQKKPNSFHYLIFQAGRCATRELDYRDEWTLRLCARSNTLLQVLERFGTINAANLKRAHALIETGKARGKIVLEGWD